MCDSACLADLLSGHILANALLALSVCFAACVALYISMTTGQAKLLVTFHTLSKTADMQQPDILTLFVQNMGAYPVYILGCGYKVRWCGKAISQESRHTKPDMIYPSGSGYMRIQLSEAVVERICQGFLTIRLLRWLLKHKILRKTTARYIARCFKAYVIAGDGTRHYMRHSPKGIVEMLQQNILRLF